MLSADQVQGLMDELERVLGPLSTEEAAFARKNLEIRWPMRTVKSKIQEARKQSGPADPEF